MKNLTPPPPASISPEAGIWWTQLCSDYRIEDSAGLLLLETALQCFDRVNLARSLIAEHGAVTADRFGQLRPNPALALEKDARAAMLSALKAMNLDLEPLQDGPGRPAGR